MSHLYEDWAIRIVPPRSGNVRAVAVNATSQAVELDNDVFQFAPGGNAVGRAGDYGKGLLVLQAEGCDMYVLVSPNANVAVNSAAVGNGATVGAYLPQTVGGNPNEGMVVEINPTIDKYVAVASKNGSNATGTLRYWVRSAPMAPGGASQGGA